MKFQAKHGIPPLVISITSAIIEWAADDDVGGDYEKFFREELKNFTFGLVHLLPGLKSSDLQYLRDLEWEEEVSLVVGLRYILESAVDNSDNPFRDALSATFRYRIIFDLDITDVVEPQDSNLIVSPEVYVNEVITNLYISVLEWPYGHTDTDGFEYDDEYGYSMIPMDIVEFMGDTYDIHRG